MLKKEKLTFKGIRNVLSKGEMKNIMAGSGSCLLGGAPCNADIQCCSNDCSNRDGNQVTGVACKGDAP